jgi:hypothetical protein
MGSSPAITTAEQADRLAKLVLSGIELLGEATLFRFTRAEQLDHGRNLEDLDRALYATRVGWVRELENSGAAAELSYSSTRTLLRDVLLLGVGEVSDLVRAATMTLPGEPLSGGDIPARLPQVGDALLAGELGARRPRRHRPRGSARSGRSDGRGRAGGLDEGVSGMPAPGSPRSRARCATRPSRRSGRPPTRWPHPSPRSTE